MLDPWDELETLQKGRRDSLACARDLEAIRDSCIREHGKRHVVECPECWTRLINRLRDRYLNSAIKEWFSGRRPFLQELDDLFSKARQHEVDFKTIEQRIADEKKEWLRDKVRNLSLHLATKSLPEARALQQKMNDRDIPIDQLVSELRECLGVDAELYDEVSKTFSKQVKTAQPPKVRAHAYIDALFEPERDPAGGAKSQKYIDMIADGKPVAEVINTMTRDRQSTKGDLDQKQKLQKKLEELRRARAAHELDKNKRDQMRQEKARASMKDAVDTLPPCSVCSKKVNARKFLACPLCQLLSDPFKVLDEPTLFCSDTCHDEGYDSHVKASHECSSGPNCLSLDDTDSKMEVDEPLVVFCRECVTVLGQASIFCSLQCYDGNFQQHRDGVHLPERERRDREIDDRGQLEFHLEDDTRYSARRIEEHIISLRDAMTDWQQRTEASIS
ncbi:hypothetical protein F4859DRAFT_265466 [Xylaria cf. heliscus]|nr:hypothetical protein F4859DRAFT_265466 [Xylaria cf. heliscus]